jgi:competence protein ComGC
VLAAIAIPNFVKARNTSQKNTCINNLRMIDAAKQQWALENNKKQSDIPTWQDIQPYLGKGKGPLHCPQGGEYTIGAVDQRPTCSIPEHVLP